MTKGHGGGGGGGLYIVREFEYVSMRGIIISVCDEMILVIVRGCALG